NIATRRKEHMMTNCDSFGAVWAPRVLSVLRIITGFIFMPHGGQKLFGYPGGKAPVELMSLMGLAGCLELFGGALLLFGLFTRPVAFVMSGFMATAYFMAHAPRG